MDLIEFIEEVGQIKLTPDQKSILIIGGGANPTGRSLYMRDRLLGLGFDVKYHQLGDRVHDKQTHSILVYDEFGDFGELELKAMAHMSNPIRGGATRVNPDDANYLWPQGELPPDKHKGPKGPRTKWGKLR